MCVLLNSNVLKLGVREAKAVCSQRDGCLSFKRFTAVISGLHQHHGVLLVSTLDRIFCGRVEAVYCRALIIQNVCGGPCLQSLSR